MTTRDLYKLADAIPCVLCHTLGGPCHKARARPVRFDVRAYGLEGYACADCHRRIVRETLRSDPTAAEIARLCAEFRAGWTDERWADQRGWTVPCFKRPRWGSARYARRWEPPDV